MYSADYGLSETCFERNRPPVSGQTFFLLSVSFVWSFFYRPPFRVLAILCTEKRQSGEGALAKELVWIFRGIPILGQNAEGCTEEIQSNREAFIGVDPGLPNFVPRISQSPDGLRNGKNTKAPHEDKGRTGAFRLPYTHAIQTS